MTTESKIMSTAPPPAELYRICEQSVINEDGETKLRRKRLPALGNKTAWKRMTERQAGVRWDEEVERVYERRWDETKSKYCP